MFYLNYITSCYVFLSSSSQKIMLLLLIINELEITYVMLCGSTFWNIHTFSAVSLCRDMASGLDSYDVGI